MLKRASRPDALARLPASKSLDPLVNVQRIGRLQSGRIEDRASLENRAHTVAVEIAFGAEGDRSEVVAADEITTRPARRVAVAVSNRTLRLEAEPCPCRVTRLVVRGEIHRFGLHRRGRRRGARLWGQTIACTRVPRGCIVGGCAITHLLKKLGGLGNLVGLYPACERRNEHRKHDANEAQQERSFDQAQARTSARQGRATLRGATGFGKRLAGVVEARREFDRVGHEEVQSRGQVGKLLQSALLELFIRPSKGFGVRLVTELGDSDFDL
jgi:hypothetical protein